MQFFLFKNKNKGMLIAPSKLNCTLLRSCETRYYFKCVCAVRLLLYLVFCACAGADGSNCNKCCETTAGKYQYWEC
ncbi:hypothetical protein ABMA28_007442 [Loxostege sticticalis]|uniref:Uncharacterized protein n=1 Tax=Loxostege sticticalis TaxID=481309 RepID=A0ABD0SHI4_LOXSC